LDYWEDTETKCFDKEIWKTIKEAKNYQISNFGRVRCLERKKGSHYKKEDYPIILKQRFCHKKYCNVTIRLDCGYRKTLKVHRLVGLHFIKNTKNLPQINHIDGVKRNNCVNNLEWICNGDNMRHSYKIGLRDDSSKGEKNGRSILTKKEVIYIYTNPDNLTVKELSNIYNISKSSIRRIYTGKNWSHLTSGLEKNYFKKSLDKIK